MDREEAIYTLKNTAWLGTDEDRDKTEQAVDMAIKSLSAEQKEEELAEDIARRMATIIENEQDMRVILKNASDDRPTEEWKINCTDFVDWLLEKVLDEEDWDMNYQAYGEIICRKLKKLGVVTVKDGYYIIADDADRPSGEWEQIEIIDDDAESGVNDEATECSICGYVYSSYYWAKTYFNYCPNCGVRMKAR